uniref:Uncharacterized protein n=1 Tax=Fagus sylvatica TaxID=28930 RepID=A0A2N9G8V6_FAGSY
MLETNFFPIFFPPFAVGLLVNDLVVHEEGHCWRDRADGGGKRLEADFWEERKILVLASRVCPRRCSYKNQIAKVGRDSSQMDGATGVSKEVEQGGETALFGIGGWVLLCS